MKVALVYDRVNSVGGAEAVLWALHDLYPDAPLYTAVWDQAGAPWSRGWEVRPSWLQRFPPLRRRHRLLGWLMPLIFETMDFSQYDVVISVTSEAAKAVLTTPEQLHICYLLTPTRYLWSHATEYEHTLPTWLQPLWRQLRPIWQAWDRVAAQRPDYLLPLSHLVAQRVHHFYQRKCLPPLAPPVTPLPAPQAPSVPCPDEFLFSWGRHVPYKRFAEVIYAGAQLGLSVVLAGSGPDTERLRALGQAQHVDLRLTGHIPREQLAWYVQQAQAVVFPQEEDFGITIMEALLAGGQVVTAASSGAGENLAVASLHRFALNDRQDMLAAIKQARSSRQHLATKARHRPTSQLDIRSLSSEYAGVTFTKRWHKMLQQCWHEQQQQQRLSTDKGQI